MKLTSLKFTDIKTPSTDQDYSVQLHAYMLLNGISNGIPELIEKEKQRKSKLLKRRTMKAIWIVLVLLGIVLLSSCGAVKQKTDKVTANEKTYYPQSVYYDSNLDTLFFVEFNRNGTIRNSGVYPVSEVVIEKRK